MDSNRGGAHTYLPVENKRFLSEYHKKVNAETFVDGKAPGASVQCGVARQFWTMRRSTVVALLTCDEYIPTRLTDHGLQGPTPTI